MINFVGRRAAAVMAALALASLAGCKPDTPNGGATQVVARVGGTEISMLQFNHALKRLAIPNPGEPVRREVTEKLIDRELAVQQALAEKLDRQPEILLQLEESRRDVLARAYAERIAATAAKPSENEAARYYAQHPELFAERKIFRLREAALAAGSPALPEVKARFAQKQSLQQVSDWLRHEKVVFNEQVVIRAAEQLPVETLPSLNAATEGQTVLFESPRGLIAYQIISSQPAPMAWVSAKPIIREYLARQSSKGALDARLKHLRSTVDISYVDELASAMAGGDVPGIGDRRE